MSTTIAPPRTRKPRGQGPSRRGEILAAAKQIFLREGIEHATMRRIATEVGVSSTALYVYFPDKMSILQAIAEAMFEALLVAYAASQDDTKPPQERFRAGLRAYVDFALSRPDEYRLTFDWKASNPCAEADAATKSFDMLQQHVGGMMQSGLFRTNDTLLVAEALWACLHGVAMLLINQADHVESDHDRLIDGVIDAAMRGFGT